MIVCSPCKKIMRCTHNGTHCHFNAGHAYVGDTFLCDTCGNETVVCNASAARIPPLEVKRLSKRLGSHFIEMNQPQEPTTNQQEYTI